MVKPFPLLKRHQGDLRSRLHLVRIVPLISTFLIVMILAILGFDLWRGHARIIADGEHTTYNLAQVLEEQTARTIQAIDLTILSVNDTLTLLSLDQPARDAYINQFLRQQLASLPYVRAIFVIGADGFIIYDTDRDTPHVSLADRGYFKAHHDNPNLGLYIGPPLISRSVNKWFISMSRRLSRPDGTFAGVIVVAVEPAYFQQFYGSINVGGGGSIALFQRDGTLMVRSPPVDAMMGKSFADSVLFRDLLPRADQGTYRGDSAVDGVKRIGSYRIVPGLPLVVAIGLSEQELLASWYSSLEIYGIAGLTFTTAIVALTFLLVQQLRRREVLIKAMQASEAQLQQSQKIESIGQLAGGIAHDFNNLLTAIIMNVDFARSRFPADDPITYELDEIQQAADRAAALTRQLLAFARKQTIAPQVLDCNELILNIDKMLRRLIGEHIELVIHPAAGLGLIKADASQIEQLLVNLALNARDAMPNGGKLTITTSNTLIEATGVPAQRRVAPSPCVQLIVSDTGVGIPPEVQAHMFEPFFTTKELGQGTGLGLATCYGIVTQHGGTIEVASAVGQGTTMTIYLPIVEGVIDDALRAESVAALPLGTETILLVEDEVLVRETAGRVLRAQGYTVLEAANGEEALWVAASRNGDALDLLLTDMVMPRMGGIATAEQLSRVYPSVKVLFMSGYTGNAKIQQGALEHPIDLLQKPFSPTTLAHKVREALDRP